MDTNRQLKKSFASRVHFTVDWAALLVALIAAAAVRFGVIGRVPW